MKFSRRDFIHAGCTAAAATLIPHPVEAWFHGSAIASTNTARTSLNVPGGVGLMNLASQWTAANGSGQIQPSVTDNNGYPTGTIASNYSGNIALIPNFYGQYVLQYSGQGGGCTFIGLPSIVYSGGASVAGLTSGGGPAGTGYCTNNFQTTSAAVSPSVVFKLGGLVASVGGGGGSLVTITLAAAFAGFTTGTKVSFNQGCSVNLVSGPNSDGSWTITNTGPTTFTLNNSTGVVSPTVTGSGGVGTQTEAVIQVGVGSFQYNSGTYTSFTSLVVCKQTNLAAIQAGQFYDADFVAQLQKLKGTPGGSGRPGNFWLRFMDISGAQSSFECDFSQRLTTSQQAWYNPNNGSGYYRSGYLTPSTNFAITNGGSDNYTCADPSVSTLSGGNYIDNAIVQGVPSATNSGGNPTLAVGTGPAKPIFGFGNTWTTIMRITAAPTTPGTDILQFTFQATWLNSNVAVTCNYQTVSGDSNTTTLANNLQTFFNSSDVNATKVRNAGVDFTNPDNAVGPTCTAPTAQAGRLSVTYSGTATITPSTITLSAIGTTTVKTFVYNYLMDGWIYRGSDMVMCQPFESIIELCNRVGANCWYNLGFTKSAFITSLTQLFAGVSGLTSGLKFGIEAWNETWNPGANPHGQLQVLGRAFAWNDGANGSDGGYTGLRTLQYCTIAQAAWTGQGRSASDFWMMQMSQLGNGVGSGFQLYQLQGQLATTSNSFYASYGGLGGVGGSTNAGTDYSSYPNRPVDFPYVYIGCAPYWNSRYLGNGSFTTASQLTGTVAQQATMLQSSIDYANGLTTTAFASLVNQFNRVGTAGPNTGAQDFVSMQAIFTQQESIASSYDNSGRSVRVGINHYEGGPAFGMGANGNTGVQSIDNQSANIQSGDITALVNRITALGWTTAQLIPYTVSGTGNITEVATNILVMLQGWKYDLNVNGTAASTSSYSNMIQTSYYQALANTSGINRETHAGQFGYAGNNWGFLWSAWNTPGSAYQNFNAMQAWNT